MELGSGTLQRCNIPSWHGGVLPSPNIERPEGLPCLELLQDTITVTICTRKQPPSSCLQRHVLGDLTFLGERPRLPHGPSCHHSRRLRDKHVRQELGFMWAVYQQCHSHPVGGWRECAAHSHLRVAAGRVYVCPGTAPIIPSIGCSPWREPG